LETEYLHALEGDNPVFDWTKGTALRPYLDELEQSDRDAFLAAYAARIGSVYPKQQNGRTLLPFRRLFLVAQV
jgi:trans-aconitate 2-methyltransferase